MAGRYPFDASGGRGPPQQQLNSAQMRAALGLAAAQAAPVAAVDEATAYLQAAQQQQQAAAAQAQAQVAQQVHRRQQEAEMQRDLQLRQLLLQEQLEQHVQEQQLRAIGEQLQDFPDLQQHYQSLLINERIQRQREQAEQQTLRYHIDLQARELHAERMQLAAANSAAQAAAAQQQQQQQVAAVALAQQQQQGVVAVEQPAGAQAAATLHALEAARATAATSSGAEVAAAAASGAAAYKSGGDGDMAGATIPTAPPASSSTSSNHSDRHRGSNKKRPPPDPYDYKATSASKRRKDPGTDDHRHDGDNDDDTTMMDTSHRSSPGATGEDGEIIGGVLEKLSMAVDMAGVRGTRRGAPASIRKGTVAGLLNAADDHDQMDGAATIIRKLDQVEWSDSDEDEVVGRYSNGGSSGSPYRTKIQFSNNPDECIASPRFKSKLPRLPVEPTLEDEENEKKTDIKDEKKATSSSREAKAKDTSEDGKDGNQDEAKKVADDSAVTNGTASISKKKKISAVLDYPVPIDTWWPSLNGMRRERRNNGETSDEDAFEDEPTESAADAANGGVEQQQHHQPEPYYLFRANERKIRSRMGRLLEPGVLEKLPHCRIHRVRTRQKKNSTAPEFLYCWQVSEIYPGDTIVCCSKCGSWRHAACGGHYKTYSVRENTKTPFEAVCENCHEEERFLAEYPLGSARIERQRMEHLRRTLATSAVMRQASFSKHGGTYKWPLGSVSGTHIAGHTRSVHARHDKAEKQWSDMGSRLSRGFGYRPKERVKSRTKELERLMVSVEDAEAYTERHNMLHFLMRDSEREEPVGYENDIVNLFDPEVSASRARVAKKEEAVAQDEPKTESPSPSPSPAEPTTACARKGCSKKPRFDSVFCSDACGVSALERDLMQSMFEASDLHPSVLRP